MKVTWCWSNWTFGLWWSRKLGKAGIDFGPLEAMWSIRQGV